MKSASSAQRPARLETHARRTATTSNEPSRRFGAEENLCHDEERGEGGGTEHETPVETGDGRVGGVGDLVECERRDCSEPADTCTVHEQDAFTPERDPPPSLGHHRQSKAYIIPKAVQTCHCMTRAPRCRHNTSAKAREKRDVTTYDQRRRGLSSVHRAVKVKRDKVREAVLDWRAHRSDGHGGGLGTDSEPCSAIGVSGVSGLRATLNTPRMKRETKRCCHELVHCSKTRFCKSPCEQSYLRRR